MMLDYLKMNTNKTHTENGAVTYKSTLSDCLDLFSSVGGMRKEKESEIESAFARAYSEDRNIALKLLFYARDIRGGLGERRFFRIVLRWLAYNAPSDLLKNIQYIPEYGRFDDLIVLFDTPLEKETLLYIKNQLYIDMSALKNGGTVSLMAKWLPSVNTSAKGAVRAAKKIVRYLGISEAHYRKTLSSLREEIRIIENNLRQKDYTFDYSKQPSKAMFKYRRAFMRNDEERYTKYIEAVSAGETKLNADTLAPYELVEPYLNGGYCTESFMNDIDENEKRTLNATWESLPVYSGNSNALAVIDTSGSMYWDCKPAPASVALSLGLYFAQHSKGKFRNHFIEFSSEPKLIEIKGETFADRLRYVSSFCEVANTNLEAVFRLILDTAVAHNLDQCELPDRLVIISDMEFDCCVNNAEATNYDNAKAMFESHRYKLPEVVFWNVASRNRQVPVTVNEQGVILVSGCTPGLFAKVADNTLTALTPYEFMLEVLGSERYGRISA